MFSLYSEDFHGVYLSTHLYFGPYDRLYIGSVTLIYFCHRVLLRWVLIFDCLVLPVLVVWRYRTTLPVIIIFFYVGQKQICVYGCLTGELSNKSLPPLIERLPLIGLMGVQLRPSLWTFYFVFRVEGSIK